MNIVRNNQLAFRQKPYSSIFIVYSLVYCFIITALPSSTPTTSTSSLVIHEEKLLRQFVSFIQSTSHNSNACSLNLRKSNTLSNTINLNETFHPIFHSVITQKSLTKNFLHDIYKCIEIVRTFNRWYYQSTSENSITLPSVQHSKAKLEEYLTNLLHLSRPVRIHNAESLIMRNLNLKPVNNATTSRHDQTAFLTYNHSNLLGIGYCRNDLLKAYVNNYTSTPISNSNAYPVHLNEICSQFRTSIQAFNNHEDTISFSDFQYGKFSSFWAPVKCDTNSFMPIVLRYFIYNTEMSLFFEFDIKDFVIDQCALDMNRCRATTRCVYKRYYSSPFNMDNYNCECAPGYYIDNIENGYSAPLIDAKIQEALASNEADPPRFYCRPCPPGCSECKANKLCSAQFDYNLLRAIPLAFQSFCITICLLFGMAMFKIRRARVVKSANLVLMEIMLVGAILLYSTIVVMYFPVTDISCLILPWFREVGFSVMYGVLIVKIYRVLSGFQSRKAHRVHVRDKDILKYLGLFIIITFTYMIAWTAINLDYISSSPWVGEDHTVIKSMKPLSPSSTSAVSMKQEGFIKVPKQNNRSHFEELHSNNWDASNNNNNGNDNNRNGSLQNPAYLDNSDDSIDIITFEVCRAMSWDVVVELAEFIILAISIHYCRLVRTAPTEYNETQYISVALIIEMTVSGLLHLLRHFIWYSVHPDYIFLLYFARSHITITVNLLLIFVPKVTFLCRSSKSLYNTSRSRGSPGAVFSTDPHLATAGKLNLVSNGDLDIADVNLADMDPEVIRRELKRLYTQIELYKTKAMRKDNPHISKRRGGRKQRRFSLQPFHKRHHGQTSSVLSGNVPLVGIQSDTGCCCNECQSSKFTIRLCPHHCSRHTSGASRTGCSATSGTGGGGGGSGGGSINRGNYSTVLHDEEISKLSEESTNSADDHSSLGNLLQAQQQQQPTHTQSSQQLPQSKLSSSVDVKHNDKETTAVDYSGSDTKPSKSKSSGKTR
uniref:G-protein coupled receptors family 3 profile domain-containing protein n=1 Tax=Trichobilharzia regenti TaxID=157069 RepID=A0AA85JQF7_TRIRE|nr:unnamed protein product [Trichobilharzia regenti]